MTAVTYDRPVNAALMVHLDNGETFEATPEDLAKFGLVQKRDAYMAFSAHLSKVFLEAGLIERDRQLTQCALNPLRYLVELAVTMPGLLTHPQTAETDAEVVALERALREAGFGDPGSD